MENIRDPLVLVYQTLKKAIKTVHGQDFLVLDDFPTADSYRKQNRNASNISFISASSEKGLMREFVPHKTVKNNTDNKFTIVIETLRMEYVIQISFFANKKGMAQMLSTKFIDYLEQKNELELVGDKWQESMNVFLMYPPASPEGDTDLWQVNQTWQCSAKLLTEKVVDNIKQMDFKKMIKNVGNISKD